MLGLTGAVDKDAARLRLLTDKFGRQSENTGDTINRLVNQLVLLDTASRDTATSLAGLSTSAMVELSDAMVDAFGGLDAASQAIAVFDAQFRTDAERLTQAIMAASRNISTGLNDMIADLAGNLGGADLAILREQLMGPLLASRDGFIELIESIDLTTEAGRNLYAALLNNDAERATRELTEIFSQWGMTLPSNRDALMDLYRSGALTTEQMAILAAHLRELGIVFGDVSKTIPDGGQTSPGIDFQQNARDAYNVLAKAVDAERDMVNTVYQARVDAINSERDGINAAYESRIAALDAERSAIEQAGEARIAALAGEREAAQAALSAATAALSTIQSAISGLRGSIGIDEFSRARAQRQLQAWAASGTLPDAAALEKTVPAATAFAEQDFATAAAYRVAQGTTLASLTALEKLGLGQVNVAQQTLDSIESQTQAIRDGTQAQLDAIQRQVDSANLWRDQQLDALQDQLDAANAWRDSEMERLDQILDQAKQQLDIALGEEEINLSLQDAIVAFNNALLALDPERQTIAVEPITMAMDASALKMESAINQQSVQQLSIAAAAQNESVALRTEIALLRADLAAGQTAQFASLKSLDDRLRKWDGDGLPPGRDDDVVLVSAA